jgi:hypothetical protein
VPKKGVVLQHGHAVIGKAHLLGLISFHERFWPRNEDSLFARDVLWSDQAVVVMEEVLSTYVTSTSSGRQKQSLKELIYRFSFLAIVTMQRLLQRAIGRLGVKK